MVHGLGFGFLVNGAYVAMNGMVKSHSLRHVLRGTCRGDTIRDIKDSSIGPSSAAAAVVTYSPSRLTKQQGEVVVMLSMICWCS